MNKEHGHCATQNAQAVDRLDTTARTSHDVAEHFREYAREKPEVVALWCLGIGFVLGWKLKPW